MNATATDSLLGVFQQLTDPRDPRGVRHPFAGLLAIVFLGLLSRQCDFANIGRWATAVSVRVRSPGTRAGGAADRAAEADRRL
jgi:hypothetical protein